MHKLIGKQSFNISFCVIISGLDSWEMNEQSLPTELCEFEASQTLS